MHTEQLVTRALVLLADVFGRTLSRDLALDEDDSDIAIDHTDDAGREVMKAFFVLRPDVKRMLPRERVAVFKEIFREAPDLDCVCVSETEHVEFVLREAWNALVEAAGGTHGRLREHLEAALASVDALLALLEDTEAVARSRAILN